MLWSTFLNFEKTGRRKRTSQPYGIDPLGLISVKDEKVGIVNNEENIVLPNEYKGIYKNDLYLTNPVRIYGDGYIMAKI